MKRQPEPGLYDLRTGFSHSRLSETEAEMILYCFANSLLEDTYGLRHRDTVDWAYNFVQAFQAANLTIDTDSALFRAATDSLWTLLFKTVRESTSFGYASDEDDWRLLHVVSWLLVAGIELHHPADSLPNALDKTLKSGHVRVAHLFWSRISSKQRSSRLYEPWDLRNIASSRSKTAPLLLREMLSHHARPIISAVSQYGDVDVFSTLLPDVFRFVQEKRQLRHLMTSYESISLLITGCVRAEPENIAVSKLRVTLKFLHSNSIPISADLVDADAFMAATARGYHEIFNHLIGINKNPCITNVVGVSALHVAAKFGELDLLKKMLSWSPLGYREKELYVSLMHVGLLSGQLDVLHTLDQHIQDLFSDTISLEQWRDMLCSCHHQHRCLDHRKCKLHGWPRSQTSHGTFEYIGGTPSCYHLVCCVLCFTALRACNEGLVRLLEFCLHHGADPDWPFLYTSKRHPPSPLHAALDASFVGLRRTFTDYILYEPLLCPHGGPLWAWSYFFGPPGQAPERMECARLLYQRGATLTNQHLQMALLSGEWNMAQLLLEHDVPPTMRALEAAICGQSTACIQGINSLLEKDYDDTTLCAAVFFSSKCLLSRRISLDLLARRDGQSPGTLAESTAIGLAAMLNDIELLLKLLDNIPRPSQACIAIYTDRREFDSDKLIGKEEEEAREGNPFWSVESNPRVSPLVLAALKGNSDGISILLGHGIKPDFAACCVAVLRRRPDILSLLLHGQPELHQWKIPEAGTLQHGVPLATAAGQSDIMMARQLLSAGANIDGSELDGGGCNPLRAAVRAGDLNMTQFLLKQGAHVEGGPEADIYGSAMAGAMFYGNFDLVKLLLDNGADVNYQPSSNIYGLTCLGSAAITGRYHMIKLLMDKGLKTTGKHRITYVNYTHLAESFGHYFLVQHLRSFGGWTEWDDIAIDMLQRGRQYPSPDLAKVEVEASLELSRRTAVGGCLIGASVPRDGGGDTERVVLSCEAGGPFSFPMSPRALMGGGMGPMSPWDTPILSPPPYPHDDEEKQREWMQQHCPSLMWSQSVGQEVEGDEVDTLD